MLLFTGKVVVVVVARIQEHEVVVGVVEGTNTLETVLVKSSGIVRDCFGQVGKDLQYPECLIRSLSPTRIGQIPWCLLTTD